MTYKIGDRVNCNLTGSTQNGAWYTGTVFNVEYTDGNLIVDIVRDDGECGSGKKSSWNTILSEYNTHLINHILGDWDE